MHFNVEFLLAGIFFLLYGGAICFWPRAAAYIGKVSLDKYWLPQNLVKYSVPLVDGAFGLGLGASLIVAAFIL